jgi:ribosomal-protein-alanine N-acetyltransferase
MAPDRDPRILPATVEDLEAICEVARASFPSPWPREAFATEVGRSDVALDVFRPAPEVPVCAFIHYALVADEIQLHNIAVRPEHRGRGHALALMRDLVRRAHHEQFAFVTLEVRRGNARAMALYQGMGFAPVGVRQRYYADNQEDAIIMLLEKP